MDAIKQWALLVAVCVVFIEFCAMLMPRGESKKTALLVLGLVVVLALVLPMGNFYKILRGMDFSYETERNEITENAEVYTENQMMEVTKEYKQRLTIYMCQLVQEVEGVEECQVDFIMEEDYGVETYGIVKRIYVTVYPRAEEKPNGNSSGFLEMPPIEKIEITLDGVTLIAPEEPEQADTLTIAISHVLQEAFRLEETCIFVEVKHA